MIKPISLDKVIQALAGIVNFSFALCLVNLHCAWSICIVLGQFALCLVNLHCAWSICIVLGQFALCLVSLPSKTYVFEDKRTKYRSVLPAVCFCASVKCC